MPTDEKETQQRLRDAQSDLVETPEPTPNAQEEAESFGEVRERHSHWQFWAVFAYAIFISLQLYMIFLYWATHREYHGNWHVGLMLIIPATAILLTLILSLRHKRENFELSDFAPQLKHFAETIKIFKEL